VFALLYVQLLYALPLRNEHARLWPVRTLYRT